MNDPANNVLSFKIPTPNNITNVNQIGQKVIQKLIGLHYVSEKATDTSHNSLPCQPISNWCHFRGSGPSEARLSGRSV